jgi:hypothetical protein
MRPLAPFLFLLIGIGLTGVASLLAMPVEYLATRPLPVSVAMLRALLLVQPAMLTIGAGLLGAALAPKIGLDAPAIRLASERRSPLPVLVRQIGPAALVAVMIGFLLAAYGSALDASLSSLGSEAKARVSAMAAPVPVRVLYGGVTEEIIARWGAMTLMVWTGWRLSGRPAKPSRATFWVGNLLAALAFAVGHLPILLAVMPEPSLSLLVLVVSANVLAGTALGYLFWRHGLEASMFAHALSHIVGLLLARLL